MSELLSGLGFDDPVLAAPMAGGPSTPELISAAIGAGHLAFLPGGYLLPDELAERLAIIRGRTSSCAVNLFAPNPLPIDPAELQRYARAITVEAKRHGLELAGAHPREDDDAWAEKVDLLLTEPVAVVSFTFGIPSPQTIAAFRRAGTITIQTVTSPAEARAATDAGVDALAVQSSAAGGHFGTLTPREPVPEIPLPELVRSIAAVCSNPIIAAGGVSKPEAVTDALSAGATAVMVGTVLLRSLESGASATYKAALADPTRTATAITRAFTGRPARALVNRFVQTYDAVAPFGYPAVHYLTSGLRRAAAAAGDPELVNLWAGTGYRGAIEEPVATILDRLTART
ncbi:MAG: nitronate monooxygenase [Actinobacteria bacterium]|nr:nitronate monooxygenase [Actinomycetota bacterium]